MEAKVHLQNIEEINKILEPETGWRVELGISPHDKSEFLRLYRKTGESWDEKEFLAVFPRDSGAGTLVACGMVAQHYFQLASKSIMKLAASDKQTNKAMFEIRPDTPDDEL